MAKTANQRKTVYTHPDGTTSERNSATKVYEWAIQAVTDLHALARTLHERADEERETLASFERAVKTNKVIKKTKPLGRDGKRSNFEIEDPTTGERHWLGAENRDQAGNLLAWDRNGAFDAKQCVTNQRETLTSRIERTEKDAAELLAGPQHRYEIVRWSETERAATNALNTFRRNARFATHHLVQAHEA